MTQSEIFIGLAGGLLALLFAYVPGFKTAFDKLDENPKGKEYKQLIMLGLLGIVTGGAYLLSCYSPYVTYQCSTAGIWQAVFDFAVAIAINQGVYKGTKYIGQGVPGG